MNKFKIGDLVKFNKRLAGPQYDNKLILGKVCGTNSYGCQVAAGNLIFWVARDYVKLVDLSIFNELGD